MLTRRILFDNIPAVSRTQRGRPLKFGRPAELVALTLPQDVLRGLQRVHPDPARAIVSLYERRARTEQRVRPAPRAAVELAQLSPQSALIVVDPRSIRSMPGVSVVPVAAGRAFLAFEQGRGLADLELAVLERLQDPTTSATVRRKLTLLQRHIRGWRRSRRFRFSTRSIIFVERVGRPWAGRLRRGRTS
jgi:hypothetical protein